MHKSMVPVILGILGVGLWLQGCRFGPAPAMPDIGQTQIAHSADIQADPQTVRQILTTFTRAEEALRRQDLDSLMNIYSKTYKYHGIDKDELRRIWADLFMQYRDWSTTHVFSSIIVDAQKAPPTAEITCTGSLWAISKLTGQRVNIDSWYGDVHHLIYEDGAWRIRSHAFELPDQGRYVLSPHPFF